MRAPSDRSNAPVTRSIARPGDRRIAQRCGSSGKPDAGKCTATIGQKPRKTEISMNTEVKTMNEEMKTAESGVSSILLSKIQISDLNPRSKYEGDVTSLVNDIVVQGVLQPIKLRAKGTGYELIFGGRRFKALKEIRGAEGALNEGEYTLVDWDDEKCLRAAVSENKERADLSPYEEARFYSGIFFQFGNISGDKVTDELLAEKTGEDRGRINELRSLAERFDTLPKSWQEQLRLSPNCRQSDKEVVQPIITPTHWKHVRAQVKDAIPGDLVVVMEMCVKEGWTSAKFKENVEALKNGASSSSTATTTERDPNGNPDYQVVKRGLKAAFLGVGKDVAVAKLIEDALTPVEKLLAEQTEKAALAKEAAKAEKAKKTEQANAAKAVAKAERVKKAAEAKLVKEAAKAERAKKTEQANAAKAVAKAERVKKVAEDKSAKEIQKAERVKKATEANVAKAVAKAKKTEEANAAKAIVKAERVKKTAEANAVKAVAKAEQVKKAAEAKSVKEAAKAERVKKAAEAKLVKEAAKADRAKKAAEAKLVKEAAKADRVKKAA